MLEGKDLGILKVFHDRLFPNCQLSFEAIPNMSIGGWGGWKWAVGSSLAMKNAFGESVRCYCVLDRDYHLDEEIERRIREARDKSVHLHVWSRKEIENFLLEPAAIARLLNSPPRPVVVTEEEILKQMTKEAEKMRDELVDGISDELSRLNRSLSSGGANKKARRIVESRTSSNRGLADLVSGKSLLSKMSAWAQKKFNKAISARSLAREIMPNEIPRELAAVIRAIEGAQPFAKVE